MRDRLIVISLITTIFGLVVDLAGLPAPIHQHLVNLTSPNQPDDLLSWMAYAIALTLFVVAVLVARDSDDAVRK